MIKQIQKILNMTHYEECFCHGIPETESECNHCQLKGYLQNLFDKQSKEVKDLEKDIWMKEQIIHDYKILDLTNPNKKIAEQAKKILQIQDQLEKFKKSEKELSDAYLRIRQLVGAWDTNMGGENRFEVTENKIKELIKNKE